jgi:hypothetical protein
VTVALYATVWAALALFAMAEAGRSRFANDRGPASWARPALLTGACLMVTHVLIALGLRYSWNHDAAVAETARQAAAVYGFEWRGNIYVSYAFVLIWALEVWRWRSRQIAAWVEPATWAWRGFALLIIANGAIVFATTTLSRAAGTLVVAALIWAWWPRLALAGGKPAAAAIVATATLLGTPGLDARPHSQQAEAAAAPQTLDAAYRLFYNARYEEAAALALSLRDANPGDLAVYELRTSALLFQLKALLDGASDKEKAFKSCAACPALMDAFLADIKTARGQARGHLKDHPTDETALFFLGKINLNYVWLQLGTLGRRTGWDEYWEARKSLDLVLKRNPRHVRARVARAWIDYIVDTKMPWGTGWVLGGGNKKKALASVREAAESDAEFFAQVEADFALWDLHVRERRLEDAVPVARGLAQSFPENREIARFLDTHDPQRRR